MKATDVFPSNFLKAENLKNDAGKYGTMIVTVKSIDTSEFDDGKKQRVLSFEETPQALGINKTNWNTIAEITGQDDDDNWIGACLELWVDTNVFYQGKRHPGIRIREPQCGVWPDKAPSNGKATGTEPELTKNTAWARWKEIDSSEDPAASFKSAVGKIESEHKKGRDSFDAKDWKAVLARAVTVINESDPPF